MAYQITSSVDKDLAAVIQKQMNLVKSDYYYMANVISGLHKKYNSTKEETHHGKILISESKFEGWAIAKAKEICPIRKASDKKLQEEIVGKTKQLQFVDCGFEECVKVELSYSWGGRQRTKCVFLAAKGMPNDKIALVYGLYSYEWNEADNWKLNCSYWETADKKKKLKNWILFRAAQR